MGVKPCEIELRRFLLLIGEQASGKSTIAKLIYFFQTLPDAIYENSIASKTQKIMHEQVNFDFQEHINLVTRRKFLETFGPTTRGGSFSIKYYYKDTYNLKIYQGTDKRTYASFDSFGNNFGYNIGAAIKNYFNAPRLDQTDEINNRHILKSRLDELFNRETTAHTYLIAGRNTIVAYPETFEKVIEAEFEKLIEDEVKGEDFERRQRLGNELLLYQFVQWSKGVRNIFKNSGQTFSKIAATLENKESLKLIERVSENILKGIYRSDEWGEQIQLQNSALKVYLKDASSGQQEVLRLLQGLFLATGLKNRKEFFVVEEPEAHLYPIAQKELMNAFAIFLNAIQESKIVVTTHSPYILACVNILLMASLVGTQAQNGQKEKATQIVNAQFWLNPDYFSAYSLENSNEYCKNIKDAETGLIDQNYLDTISEQLGMQFNHLLEMLN
jgi:predicted ATPase